MLDALAILALPLGYFSMWAALWVHARVCRGRGVRSIHNGGTTDA